MKYNIQIDAMTYIYQLLESMTGDKNQKGEIIHMKRLKKLTRNQKEFLVRKLGVESKNYLVERNTSEFTVFFNIKTSEKIIYHKTFDSLVEEI